MTNIKFPETNVVKAVFSYRQNRCGSDQHLYDEHDRLRETHGLKEYFYRVPDMLKDTIRVGEPVLVHCATGYQVCEITEINVLYSKDVNQLAPVICHVNLNAYFEEVERAKTLAAMKQNLDAEMAKIQKTAMYDLLAEKNPEFAAMLAAYKQQGGTF